MRICFVALNYEPSVGGAQDHVQAVAIGLARRGHHVTVLTTDALRTPMSTDPGVIRCRRETCHGVEVRRFPFGRLPARVLRLASKVAFGVHERWFPDRSMRDPYTRPWFVGPLSWRLAVAVWRAHRVSDVVVALPAPYLTLVVPPALRCGADSVTVAMPLLHLDHAVPHRRVVASLRRCDVVLTSTQVERKALLEVGVDAGRVTLIPPGTDLDEFVPRTPSVARSMLSLPDLPIVGYLGRLVAYKGIDVLADAVIRLWDEGREVAVLFAGATSTWAGFEAVMARLTERGGDQVIVRRDFPDADKALLLAACDVVACPSRDESFGMVIAEAWAASRPVVASDLGAVREVMTDGEGGLLVPVGDPTALADALSSLLDDPERRRLLGGRGRRRVERTLTWDRIVDQWEQVMVQARSNRNRRPESGRR